MESEEMLRETSNIINDNIADDDQRIAEASSLYWLERALEVGVTEAIHDFHRAIVTTYPIKGGGFEDDE